MVVIQLLPENKEQPSDTSHLTIDAAMLLEDNKACIFIQDKCYQYDTKSNKLDPGYPVKISRKFKGIWSHDIDAAVNWGNGKVYFFKGNMYMRYDLKNKRVDPGYPYQIARFWPGVWEQDIDAIVNWGNGKIDPGYPQPIEEYWPASLVWINIP